VPPRLVGGEPGVAVERYAHADPTAELADPIRELPLVMIAMFP